MPTVSIVIESKKTELEVDSNQTILDELLRQDVDFPKGCLSGACGVCRMEILEGVENLSPTSAVEAVTIASICKYKEITNVETVRLACRAKALGNVRIRIID